MISRHLLAAVPAAAIGGTVITKSARADGITYTFSTAVDFTGPFADVMPSWHSGQRAMVAWWNDTQGKELGAQVVLKVHDMRYDTSVVAQSWPGILATENPPVYLGMGTPDLIGLMKRLPQDKVLMIMPTAMVGPVWLPNGWEFSARPTYSQEFAALFNYLQAHLSEKRPLRIGTFSTQERAGYVDQVNGIVALAKTYPDRFAVVDKQWVDDSPVDVTDQLRRMAETKPDVMMIAATTAQVIAVARARKDLGLSIPIASASQNGLTESSKAIPLADLEGDFSVFAFAPFNQAKLPARDIYQKYHTEPGSWGIVATQTSVQTVLALRVLEKAMAAAGKDHVTGQAMYDALLANTYTEEAMLGLTPDLKFDSTRPFPVGPLKAKALVVRKGEIVPLTPDWMPVPELAKW